MDLPAFQEEEGGAAETREMGLINQAVPSILRLLFLLGRA